MKAEKPYGRLGDAIVKIDRLEKALAESEAKIKELKAELKQLYRYYGDDEVSLQRLLAEKDKVIDGQNILIKQLEDSLEVHKEQGNVWIDTINENEAKIKSERKYILGLCFQNLKTTPEDEKVLYYEDLQTIARLLHERENKKND
jgi:phosphomannomutase